MSENCFQLNSTEKQCFDRFGDDLCEYVLSFMSFEDCFRFECISKQFKRLLFDKQIDLNFDYILSKHCVNYKQVIDLRAIDSLLKKWSNVRSIAGVRDNHNKDLIFGLIVRYFDVFTEIKCDFNGLSENTIQEFCHKFGSNLKTIEFQSNFKENKTLLKCCPSLTSLDISGCGDGLSVVFNLNQLLVKGLQKLSLNYTKEDGNRFEALIECNKNSLKSIEVFIKVYHFPHNVLIPLFEGFSKLSQLKSLSFDCKVSIDNSFKGYLTQIANNCPKVEKLDLRLNISNLHPFLHELKHFKGLKKLNFMIYFFIWRNKKYSELEIRCNSFEDCRHLTHLSIDLKKYTLKIKDRFFNDIHRYLPKLRDLYITNTDITDTTFYSLSKLKDIQRIHFECENSKTIISEPFVYEVIENCLKINSIYFKNKEITVDINDELIFRLRATGFVDSGVKVIQFNDKNSSVVCRPTKTSKKRVNATLVRPEPNV